MARAGIRIQAAYYVATGIFPFVDIDAFERITGPKNDRWLVYMVGSLAVVIGSALAIGSFERKISRQTTALSVSSALAFAAVELWFGLRGCISGVYLADAVIEGAFIGAALLPDSKP